MDIEVIKKVEIINKHLATFNEKIGVIETMGGDFIRVYSDYRNHYYDKGDNDRVIANEGEIESVEMGLYGNFYPCNFDEIDFLAMKDVYDLYDAFGIELKQ
jgi:hypothetical protein